MATLILLSIIVGYTIFIVVLMSEPKSAVQAAEPELETETKPGDQLVLDLRDVEPIPVAEALSAELELPRAAQAPRRDEFAFFEQLPAVVSTQVAERRVAAPRGVWHINDVPRRLGSPHVLDLRSKN